MSARILSAVAALGSVGFALQQPLPTQLKARNLRIPTAMSTQDKLNVNVEITSDVACPWYDTSLPSAFGDCYFDFFFSFPSRCWVGKRHFDAAAEHLKDNVDFHIRWKPFLLNPYVPDEGIPLGDYMRMKFGEAAARRFFSGDSPLVQSGKAIVSLFFVQRACIQFFSESVHSIFQSAYSKFNFFTFYVTFSGCLEPLPSLANIY